LAGNEDDHTGPGARVWKEAVMISGKERHTKPLQLESVHVTVEAICYKSEGREFDSDEVIGFFT
jgi:hypothetical protein